MGEWIVRSPNIMQVKVMSDYKLLLNFENGEEKVFDLKPFLDYPVFKPLKDKIEFKRFDLIDGTLEWKCGADLSADTFYLESIPYNASNMAK